MNKKRHDRATEADTERQRDLAMSPDEAPGRAIDDTIGGGHADGEVGPFDGAAGADGLADDTSQLRDIIADLHTQIADLQTEVAEQVDRRLRVTAELDNLRKRGRREVDDARRFAQADLLRPLLEVLDNFERALQFAPDSQDASGLAGQPSGPADNDSYRQGVALIAQRFRQVLADSGVRRIEAEGRMFDPAVHEAIGQAPAPEGAESGVILAEVQSGYTFDDLVLRASRVIVAQ